MPDAPYPPLEGYQTVVQEMASSNPKAASVNLKDAVDGRFVRELEDSGFIGNLYKSR